MNPAPLPKAQGHRRLLIGLLVFATLSVLLLGGLLKAPRGGVNAIVALELQSSAQRFKDRVVADWQQPPARLCGWLERPSQEQTAPGFGRLRCNLLFDSTLLVPAYVALFVFFTLSLSPPPLQVRQRVLRQLLCVPAVAAGLFDIAENGMTGRALDDLTLFVLADATVADVLTASQSKWWLLALGLSVLALLAWRQRGGADVTARRWLLAAALASSAAGALLALGTFLLHSRLIGSGSMAMGLALALLATWRLNHGPQTTAA
jgi:hypothetical protein